MQFFLPVAQLVLGHVCLLSISKQSILSNSPWSLWLNMGGCLCLLVSFPWPYYICRRFNYVYVVFLSQTQTLYRLFFSSYFIMTEQRIRNVALRSPRARSVGLPKDSVLLSIRSLWIQQTLQLSAISSAVDASCLQQYRGRKKPKIVKCHESCIRLKEKHVSTYPQACRPIRSY